MISNSIILIGMPGVGKTSIGKELARQLQYPFVDTDDILTAEMGMSLIEYIQKFGDDAAIEKEAQVLRSIHIDQPTVIATGGSVVYDNEAMTHLKSFGKIVFLSDTLERISQRLGNYKKRGIMGLQSQSLTQLYAHRQPYYKKWADLTIVTQPFHKQKLIKRLQGFLKNPSSGK